MNKRLPPCITASLLATLLVGCSYIVPRIQQPGADSEHRECRQWRNELIFERTNSHNQPRSFTPADRARITSLYRRHDCEEKMAR